MSPSYLHPRPGLFGPGGPHPSSYGSRELGDQKGENIDAEGKPRRISIRATNLFRKEDGKWKMIAHHVDNLAFLAR